ncbi:MAG TPA: cupredoxin family copper-binding protein, partial [Candidatus Saccharimonadales bacterium]|nr:cupredoxin family copper-binding protein [Candidatus Saccharimonadales bacterium]
RSAIISIVVAVVVLAGGGVWLASRHKSNTTNTNTASMNMNTQTTTDSNNLNPTATNQVTIENMAFTPANISISSGSTVTWTNKDSVTHTVTETDGQNGPSLTVEPGKSVVFTFDKPGIYRYHCTIHPSMTGTVTVTAAGSGS